MVNRCGPFITASVARSLHQRIGEDASEKLNYIQACSPLDAMCVKDRQHPVRSRCARTPQQEAGQLSEIDDPPVIDDWLLF
jgi:hypothetical protein